MISKSEIKRLASQRECSTYEICLDCGSKMVVRGRTTKYYVCEKCEIKQATKELLDYKKEQDE